MTRATKDGGLGFDAQWDGFVYPITTALVGADDAARDMQAVKGALLGQYNGDPFQRVLCVENHDTVGNGSARLPQRIDGKDPGSWAARKRSMLAAGLLLTAPGIPMLFMGQEFLERGSFTNPPSPLDWTKATTFGPVRDYYRDLVRLRRDKDGHSAGLRGANVAVHHVNDGAKVIGYRRWDKAGDDVIVLVNLSAKKFTQYDLGLPAAGTWTVRVDSDRTAYSTDFSGGGPATIDAKAVPRDGLPYTGSFVLGPYSIVVVSK
jgi:1,4-alpha-glucan branching enzyme